MSLRVLVRWFLDFSFQVTFLKTALVSKVDAVIFGAPDCHLACPVPQFWYPGDSFGSLGAPWGAKGAAEGTPWGPSRMTESTPWSDWRCNWKALAFQIEGFGETGP